MYKAQRNAAQYECTAEQRRIQEVLIPLLPWLRNNMEVQGFLQQSNPLTTETKPGSFKQETATSSYPEPVQSILKLSCHPKKRLALDWMRTPPWP
jgi:hypothetical protein